MSRPDLSEGEGFLACAENGEHLREATTHRLWECPYDAEPECPTLRERAQNAQDRIGWTPMATDRDGGTDFASAVLQLARVNTDLAREVERLTAEVARLQENS